MAALRGRPATAPPPPPARSAPAKRPANRQKPRKDPALAGPDGPAAYHLPTPEELDARVRGRPVGRTITSVCLDLGIFPGLVEGDFWCQLEHILRRYGGSLNRLYDVRAVREKSFERERDRRPDTWHIDWQDLRPETVRRALGYRVGDVVPPPDIPPHGLPAIVPG